MTIVSVLFRTTRASAAAGGCAFHFHLISLLRIILAIDLVISLRSGLGFWILIGVNSTSEEFVYIRAFSGAVIHTGERQLYLSNITHNISIGFIKIRGFIFRTFNRLINIPFDLWANGHRYLVMVYTVWLLALFSCDILPEEPGLITHHREENKLPIGGWPSHLLFRVICCVVTPR